MAKYNKPPYCIPQDTPEGIVMSWIAERVKIASQRHWPKELTEWAECADVHSNNHYNEPPIPVLIGFIAEAAANHLDGVDGETTPGRTKLLLWGAGNSATHSNPQPYMSQARCPGLEPYIIPSGVK